MTKDSIEVRLSKIVVKHKDRTNAYYAKVLGCSLASIKRAFKSLEDKKLIYRNTKVFKTNKNCTAVRNLSLSKDQVEVAMQNAAKKLEKPTTAPAPKATVSWKEAKPLVEVKESDKSIAKDFPFSLEIQDHPLIKNSLRPEDNVFWNAWKNDITGFGTSHTRESYILVVKNVLERCKDLYNLPYDVNEIIKTTDSKFRTFFGTL